MLNYNSEAQIWEEALPLGNGRIGAMVWSGVSTEKISLNDDTLWSGYPRDTNIPGTATHYATAQKLAMDGKYHEAQQHIETHIQGSFTQGYLPMGELLLEMDNIGGNVSNYHRKLDITNAICTSGYQKNGTAFTRESFVSAPDQVLVMKLAANKPASISFDTKFTCQLRFDISSQDNRLVLEGIAPSDVRPLNHFNDQPIVYEDDHEKRGLSFTAIVDIETVNGKVIAKNDTLRVEGADEVIIRLCCRTSYNNAKYRDCCEKDLSTALRQNYKRLISRHIEDYQALYNRVEISFGTHKNDPIIILPERLAKWEQSENDPALFALLFQYGRYLMIAGSRPDSIPLNLQGIWNPHLHPPWSSNYTTNINTEMNYWPAEITNLSECHKPLIDFVDRLRITGAKTAREYYGAGGFTVHHNADIWGQSTPVGEDCVGAAVYAFWPMAAGWFSAHAFEHYLFSMDEYFLRQTAWPIIRDAARFYLDVLVEDADGTLIFAPSTSPENHFMHEGKPCSVSKTATMTTAIIKETLANAVHCCNILGESSVIKEKLLKALGRLPDYQIGSKGEFLEWSEELPEHDPYHRHTSHLYPLHPGREIKCGTALANACARTIELRGGEGTGWALAWRVNLWARLQEAEKAFECLKKQLRPTVGRLGGCYPNLFGAHPPFQIDSNFGACAGIAEMLLQSDAEPSAPKTIMLLPALPKALGTGYVKGLRARGGVTVSIFFEDGALKSSELTLDANLSPQEFSIRYKDHEQITTLYPGKTCVFGVD
ncbi:MAG: glycoside hydrolase family 95 protein [Defluviitaleaceae bacterium]|nr:glycoside hydrolase family 95 protein [Defluviitaleaceae bacterium]